MARMTDVPDRSLMVRVFAVLAFFTLVLMSASVHAASDKTGVRVKAWVGDENEKAAFSVNEQVILSIDVSTPRWFTGGTRIGRVDIPNVIAKQRNQLATNYTTREQGQTWSHQRWEITLYPQQSGQFTIPPIAVNAQVSGEDGKSVRGTVQTAPVTFDARLPSGLLTQDSIWFTASQADVSQTWQSSTETLHVGDAVTRTITITAKDSLSVLLPDLMAADTGGDHVAASSRNYQAYAQPHQLSDTQTRGDYQSSRTEQTVYILQMGGDIQFPDYTFYWWDTQHQTLQTETVAGKSFHIAHTWRSWLAYYWPILASVIFTLLVLVVILWALRRYFQTHPKPERWQLWQRLRKGQWVQARTLIYRRLRLNAGEVEITKANVGEELPTWQQDSEAFQQEGVAEHQKNRDNAARFQRLWRHVSGKSKTGSMTKGTVESGESETIITRLRQWRLPKALPELAKASDAIASKKKTQPKV
ncbi:BatD family protein [Photobacterium japonica]|uniref:BatD family protein n=1 Tax=Photobacterium japonica TaxID=2910235 RepID=UPI003D0FF2F5